MQTCDVLIVGGGPAGSSCARRLQESGLDVLVVDRREFPRHKTCAGWITPQIIETLGIDLFDYRRGRVLQPITGFRTGMVGGDEIETHYDRTVSYGIRRCEFDHYLLQQSGARCQLGEAVRSIERSNGLWLINGRIRAPLVVGAGGHFCPVARFLGARRASEASVVAAKEVEFEAVPADLSKGTVEADVPELFFCEDLKGYGWCFRKGNFLNIGLGRVDSDRLAQHVAAFCDFLKQRGKVLCEIPSRFHGHAYQLYERSQPRLVGEGMLLIGDAAGLAYPQSGEGIRPAVESGLIAADVVLAAGGEYCVENLQPYCDRITGRLGKPRTGSITEWLPNGWLRFLAARLLASKTFAQQVVIERWFLHMDEPPLTSAQPAALPSDGE